ncbi:MAG TPA: hypothetical protein ENN13_04890 [Candidatus Altiarchaeales archaeon]|nr:hypothetical protein [Candidatus Altiarchaeales archaeon]
MENLYRIFQKNRHNPTLVERESLIRNISGKKSMNAEDLRAILEYKGLPEHTARSLIEKYTQQAFQEESLEEKIKNLRRLNGVGVVAASTILSIQNPYKHAELDHDTWETLKKEYGMESTGKDKKSDYGVKEYLRYNSLIQQIAEEHGMRMSDVQFTLKLLNKKG